MKIRLDSHKSNFNRKGCSCPVSWGTEWYPVWRPILKGLLLRFEAGETFSSKSPLFAWHAAGNPKDVRRLTYEDVRIWDEVRSKRMGLLFNKIKTHSRRSALPTILANLENVSDLDIRALGRWSLAILAFYVSMDDSYIVHLQNLGLLEAERLYKGGYKINHTFVHPPVI